eukprot:TRINITY_DN1715_c0_g3_i1.p1 TRINITY_DN1715_c0_g3~~TRINITY_DN1715_c0_g3_i1.p1  ORF type:complete len:1000 (-),score=177.85 TRINITY_DN1715_c0_g3_i1:161-3085(-)
MRCAEFEPSLRPLGALSGSGRGCGEARPPEAAPRATVPLRLPGAISESQVSRCVSGETLLSASPEDADGSCESRGRTPKCWTPAYSPAYSAGAVFPGPHLLPPPPPGAGGGGRTPYGSLSTGPGAFCLGPPGKSPCARGYESASTPLAKLPLGPGPSPSPLAAAAAQTPSSAAGRRRGVAAGPATPQMAARGRAAPRIDPESVPRPKGPYGEGRRSGREYKTTRYQMPPLVNEPCTVIDQGSCSCEFMRCTMNELPTKVETMNMVRVPIGVVWQPFAEQATNGHDCAIPLIDRGEAGPLRCSRCRAYVNPFFSWRDGTRDAVCNLCGQRMPIDDEWIQLAAEDRPELRLGTVDYVAPRDYSDGPLPSAPVIVIALDCSARSVRSGLFGSVVQSLRQLVGFLEAPASRVALLTFDNSLHFHTFRAGRREPGRVDVTDVEDPFVPCGHAELCVDVSDAELGAQFDALLEQLPGLYSDTCVEQAAGGAALQTAVELAASCGGGHVLMLHAELPNFGLGALQQRDGIVAPAKDAEGLVRSSAARFLEDVASRCSASGVAVSAVCSPGPGEFIDLASLSFVPRRTGGDVLYLPSFDIVRDGEQLHYHVSRTVVQEDAYSCVCKLRCSKGFVVEEMYAPWHRSPDDEGAFAVSRLSQDAAMVFELSHNERSEGQYAYLQAACLHTRRSGQRCIRVQTLRIKLSARMQDVFKYVDTEVLACLLLRQAAAAALNGDGGFKDKLTRTVIDILHAYRVHCASTSRSKTAHLVLPEALTYLPMYLLSIRKLAALRSSSGIRPDERIAGLLLALGMPLENVPIFLYPSIYQLAPPDDKAPEPRNDAESFHFPPTQWCAAEKLECDRIYLVDCGVSLHVYIRPGVQPELLETLFGTSSALELPAALASWSVNAAAGQGNDGAEAFKLCQQLRKYRRRQPWLPLSVVLPGSADEAKLLPRLVEDPVAHEPCYVDFLVHLHKEVRERSF